MGKDTSTYQSHPSLLGHPSAVPPPRLSRPPGAPTTDPGVFLDPGTVASVGIASRRCHDPPSPRSVPFRPPVHPGSPFRSSSALPRDPQLNASYLDHCWMLPTRPDLLDCSRSAPGRLVGWTGDPIFLVRFLCLFLHRAKLATETTISPRFQPAGCSGSRRIARSFPLSQPRQFPPSLAGTPSPLHLKRFLRCRDVLWYVFPWFSMEPTVFPAWVAPPLPRSADSVVIRASCSFPSIFFAFY